MAVKRSYGEGCGVAHALDMIGERWALLVVRELLLGPKRFTDLQAGLPGAGPNILAQRLRDLENVGVVRRRTLPPPAGSKIYELTEWGAELDQIVALLGCWGTRSPVVPLEGEVGADSLMLALRNAFIPQKQDPWTADYEIHLAQDFFTFRVVDGELVEASRGQLQDKPDAVIETDTATLLDLMTGQHDLVDAVESGRVSVTGDVEAVRRLVQAAPM
ncbi:winged helix-turn-helix transcriptional regulator [Nonomuraea sp. KM90]|uniref:winged helix-turn-helix transcriptional regulator n=1 Tax=Nonomuraea sp. KM90 TaxID=3457428 RepID=UPI003FCC971B